MYTRNEELPHSIRNALPSSAQEVYRAAYNRVLEKLTTGEAAIEETTAIAQAHEAARLAVEAEFEQDDRGHWHRDPVGEDMKQQGNVTDPDAIPQPDKPTKNS